MSEFFGRAPCWRQRLSGLQASQSESAAWNRCSPFAIELQIHAALADRTLFSTFDLPTAAGTAAYIVELG